MMNTTLVLVKPNENQEKILEVARDHFDSYGVRVDEMMVLTGPQVARGAYVERHYNLVAALATCPSEDLIAFISEETASLFFSAFGELWDTVVEDQRVMTADDALTRLGLTAKELESRWWASKSRARLEYGFYVSYFEEEGMYVVNGFYPRLRESLTARDSRVCIFILSWPESKYTWKSFRLDVLGAADPSEAEPTSLRRLLYDNWEEYGLREQPSLVNNCMDASSGPLEALAHRFVWMHRRATEDDFGRALLREGVEPDFLERLVKNPSMTYEGEERPVFELFENLSSSEVLHHVAVLFATEKMRNSKTMSSGLGLTGVLTGTADWTIVLDDEDAEERRNRALVFVKPHANTPEVRVLVEERLMRVEGIQVVSHCHVFGNEIASRNVLDKHYRTIARYAVKLSPESIDVSTQNRALFQEMFDITWKEALRSGCVWNAEAAMHALGEISSFELSEIWGSCTKILKISSGAYVAHLCNENVFVINGFYPYLRETYSAPDAKVTCYVVSWPESRMTWREFREELIGSTNPRNAPPNSLRGLIRDRWRELGLRYPPNTTDNGVHASAGPFEAVLERNLWIGSPLTYDPLTLRLQACGLTEALLYRWSSNPEVVLGSKKLSGFVFDLLENMQTSDMVNIMRGVEEQALAACMENQKNNAVVILKPFAVNTRTIEIVKQTLKSADVLVKRELSIFSHCVVKFYLNSPGFRALSHFADFGLDSSQDNISSSIKETFGMKFGFSSWDIAAGERKLMGANTACKYLRLTPRDLLRLWDSSNPVKIGVSCYVAFIKSHEVFIINGFVPFIQESYGKPGSRVYVFEVEWKETSWTWSDFCNVLIGDSNDPLKAIQGSLQHTFAEEWSDFGLQLQPVSRATSALYASSGPLEAAADREMWLGAELPEDPFVQHLLLEGVPLSLLLPYVRDEHHEPPTSEYPQLIQQQQGENDLTATAAGVGPHRHYTRSMLSRHQQSSEVVRRLKVLTSRFLRAIKMNYAFIWVKPHAGTSEVVEWVPAALEEHRVEVLASGHLSMDEVIGKHLVDQQYNALYRNAMERKVEELPINAKQRVEFERTFGISWGTAVRLHLIINAAQAVDRIGVLQLLQSWDGASQKVCLSPDLYLAYLEDEGLYVINGFYPYLRSRMYTGPRIHWFVVMWDGEILTWEEFQRYVIGGDVPATAEVASLRNSLWTSWVELGLLQQPDGIDNGFHASASPMEGLADRIAWLGMNVENDVFGQLLIQGGVNADYLRALVRNPLVRHRDEPVDAVNDVFGKLCTENPLLLAQLTGLQSTGGMHFLLTPASSTTGFPQPPLPVGGTSGSGMGKKNNNKSIGPTVVMELKTNGDKDNTMSTATPAMEAMRRNYAFLLVNPKCMSVKSEELTTAYIVDFLQRHKIEIVMGGSVRTITPVMRHVVDELQANIFRYAVKQTPSQYAIDGDAMLAFKEAFGEEWDSDKIRNAVDVAMDLNLSPSALNEVWNRCTLHKRIAPYLYVGKMRDSGLYLVNGFALHNAEVFNSSSSVKRYFLISWDNNDADYAHYLQYVIGDPYVEEAEPGSLQRILCDDWKTAGLQCPPDRFEGAFIMSTSALEAIRQKQLWLSLGLSRDPVCRFAMEELGISPYVLRWTVSNPRSRCGDGRFLFDTIRGQGTADALELLKVEDAHHRTATPRNSAFVLVKSHALCRQFAMTIEMIFSNTNIRIDEEGDLSSAVIRGRGLVHHLYTAASKYAVRDVSTIRLTKEELNKVRREFGVAWEQLRSNGVLVNAYRALEVMGGVTPEYLLECWRRSDRKLFIRPNLAVAELSEHGIYVVNGFFPELKQSLESATALLHWYIVSWPEEEMSWPAFLERVIGDDSPDIAMPQSIRGQLFRRWREYGLSVQPDFLRNGLHVSQGALQAIRDRIKSLNYPICEDYLCDIMLSHGVPEKILSVWLDNPDVTSGGVEASVFEHLQHCDTSRLLVLLTALTGEVNSDENNAAISEAARIPEMVMRDKGNSKKSNGVEEQEQEKEFLQDGVIQQSLEEDDKSKNNITTLRRSVTETDDALLFRNTAVIVVKPHAADNLQVMALLERILTEVNIRVKQEFRKESCPRLVDKHLSSSMYYALHKYSQLYPEVTEEGRIRFYDVFGEEWEYALASQRVIGAYDALTLFLMTPSQLYVKWSLSEREHVQLAFDMEVIKFHAEGVYVVNPLVPLERERMIQAAHEIRDVHCYVVSWDQRECNWKKFIAEVIGDVDPSIALETSFRGQVYKDWEKLGFSSRPNRIDNVVLASGGPLQAFMERELWCSTGDVVPDPLVRALCYLDHDASQLFEWKENPLVQYTSRALHEKPITCRMFGFTYGMDTREFIDLADESDGCFVPILPPCEAEQERRVKPSEGADEKRKMKTGNKRDFYSAAASSHGIMGAEPADWLHDMLLNPEEDDVVRLWEYYGGSADWEEDEEGWPAASEALLSATGGPHGRLRGTINGEAFRRDIEALDCYGLPLARCRVKKLFEGMAWRGDGRATYEEFRMAMAVLQQI